MSTTAKPEFHILVVNGTRLGRRFTANILKKSSLRVTGVASGGEALVFLGLQGNGGSSSSSNVSSSQQETVVDLVLIDENLQGMTGYELLRRIKESTSLKDIPVVVLPSSIELSRTTRYREGGADLMLKPLNSKDVAWLRSLIVTAKSRVEQQHASSQEATDEGSSSETNMTVDSRPFYKFL